MKYLSLLAALFVMSCAQQKYYIKTPPPADISQFTDADLANAIVIAQTSNAPVGPLIVSCFTFLRAQLASLQPPSTTPGTVGVATAFTVADLALENVTASSTALQVQFAQACGPLVIFTTNQGMALSAQVGALGTLIAPKARE